MALSPCHPNPVTPVSLSSRLTSITLRGDRFLSGSIAGQKLNYETKANRSPAESDDESNYSSNHEGMNNFQKTKGGEIYG